jgi:PIF1-like helicase
MKPVNPAKLAEWRDRNYMVIDEVSMMDSNVMERLHTRLSTIKSNTNQDFGGVNLIFVSDFLQLPSVSHLDLYNNNPESEWYHGHILWRSLNAVIILMEQIRQIGDPLWAASLSRCRIHQPTDDDIKQLNDRVGAKLKDMQSIPVVVRRHNVRQAINNERV